MNNYILMAAHVSPPASILIQINDDLLSLPNICLRSKLLINGRQWLKYQMLTNMWPKLSSTANIFII